MRRAPILFGMIHHKLDEQRDKKAENLRSIPDLGTIDGTVPGCTTMHHLVAQHIKPVKQDREHKLRILLCDSGLGAHLAAPEPLFPIAMSGETILVIPEGLEDILVFEQQADRAREALPNRFVDQFAIIEANDPCEIILEARSLAGHERLVTRISIGGVERDPEEDEGGIAIFGFLFGALEPTQRAMDAKAKCFREAITQISLLGLECIERQRHCAAIVTAILEMFQSLLGFPSIKVSIFAVFMVLDHSLPAGHERQKERACAALVGLAIGDALGAPVEFRERASFPEVRDMLAGGYFRLPAGAWTDDTAMALCLADSLLHDPDLDRRDLLNRFLRWMDENEHTSTGRCIGVGQNTLVVMGKALSEQNC